MLFHVVLDSKGAPNLVSTAPIPHHFASTRETLPAWASYAAYWYGDHTARYQSAEACPRASNRAMPLARAARYARIVTRIGARDRSR